MKVNNPAIKEIVINGSHVYIKNGKVKTQLNATILQTGFMTVEEAKALTIAKIRMNYSLNHHI